MYLDDAQPGDFCNTATGDVWRDEIMVIPCDFHTRYLEWPKVRGKGAPIADHGEDPAILRRCATNEKNQHTLPNGNRVEETAFWYLLIQNGAAVGPGAVPVDQHPPQGVAQVADGDPRRDLLDRRPPMEAAAVLAGVDLARHRREQHARRLVDLRRRARRAADRPSDSKALTRSGPGVFSRRQGGESALQARVA